MWGDVPDNILVHAFSFLRCRADRVHMAGVSRYWRAAVLGLPPLPPQLPWLFFPNTEYPAFYSPVTGLYHFLYRLPLDVRRARCCGSGSRGWLVLAPDAPAHALALYNLNSGQRIPLPPRFLPPGDPGIPFDTRVAAVSSTPPYVVAAIALVADGSTAAAFWGEGMGGWFSPGDNRLRVGAGLWDLICYHGTFFFLTAREHVIGFKPVYEHDPTTGHATPQSLRRHEYKVQRRQDYDADSLLGELAIRRYLVWSRDTLLMVVRYQEDVMDGTNLIRVFKLRAPPTTNCHKPDPLWEDLHGDLDGRMLFLGLGCSVSLEAADYEGFEGSMIYFFDEDMVSTPLADGRTLYLLTDMGMYSTEEMTKRPLPPGRGHPLNSDNAPPTWWLH
ncbi:hypothetical protein HU200_050237 [Digitaria exilis]|uniref:KIB1-4 beta-propeller domain-containing protein n=1 Tax=Digitaria exilis TaxID=1010633 RepID=A0A835ARX3_9POAL|nr:hypothetical protein HU200_050237 [Digitaria exilis]